VEGNTKWVLQNKHVIATLLVLVTCLLVMQLALANARVVLWPLLQTST
jgi:hypothetical protein